MLLQLTGVQKRFGGVAALRNACLSVRAGEVHLLMGENGAGKSTLMKIVAGMYTPDGGEILWRGEKHTFRSPSDAAHHGISMVHQESLLAPHLTVAENIFLGTEPPARLGFIRRGRIDSEAARLIAEHRFPLQPDWLVERLSPAQKQLVEICRAVQRGSSLLIFDEPTSSLSEGESREVFRIVLGLASRGVGVVYITHRLQELRSVGDRVTVLRDGVTVHEAPLKEMTQEQLLRHMAGREIASGYARAPLAPGRELLRVENLSRAGAFADISFSLRAGEIVGMAGLMGAGRTELCRCLFGIDRAGGGSLYVEGKAARIRTPADAVRLGLGLIPEDRARTGLAMRLSLEHNITLASLRSVSAFGWIQQVAERALAMSYIDRLKIKCASPLQLAGRLSGGTQQKAVIAKWLARGARVFLFDEPTRGIDVGAKLEVFGLMDSLAHSGAAILMVSSELPELLQMADRTLVLRQGRIAGECGRGATQEQILQLAVGEKQ